MKPFSAHILALTSLTLLSACSAQQASVMNTDDWTMDDEVTSSAHSGPYLEMDEDSDDTVELNLHSSSSSVQP